MPYPWTYTQIEKHLPHVALGGVELVEVVATMDGRGLHEACEHFGQKGVDQESTVFMWGLSRFLSCGQNVYVVGPAMQQTFIRTDPKDLRTEDLVLPFQGFYVATPESSWEIWDCKERILSRMTGILVAHVDEKIQFTMEAEAIYRSRFPESGAIYIGLYSALSEETCFTQFLIPTTGVLSKLDFMLERMIPKSRLPTDPYPAEHYEKYRVAATSALQIVYNLCLYLQCTNAQNEKIVLPSGVARKRRRAQRRKGESSERTRSPRITQVFPAAERYVRSRAGGEGTGRSVAWHMVRSHYRHYWVGPRDGERKRERRFVVAYGRGDRSIERGPAIRGLPEE